MSMSRSSSAIPTHRHKAMHRVLGQEINALLSAKMRTAPGLAQRLGYKVTEDGEYGEYAFSKRVSYVLPNRTSVSWRVEIARSSNASEGNVATLSMHTDKTSYTIFMDLHHVKISGALPSDERAFYKKLHATRVGAWSVAS